MSYQYNAAGRSTAILSTGGNPSGVPDINYSYDANGNVTSIVRSDTGTALYSYDTTNQLVKAELPDGNVQRYTYDPVGNRLSLSDIRGLQTYSYDAADQLMQIESTFNPAAPTLPVLMVQAGMSDVSSKPGYISKYTYDNAGNELGYTGPGNRKVKYTFDTLNRLTGVEIPGSEPVKYLYDALGRRVAIAGKNGVIKERNLYSGFGRAVLAVMDGKGKIKTRYITMPGGQLLARVDSSSNKPFYYHFDALGSTVAVTDEKGKVISRSTYDPFGARASHPATDDQYGFVGNEWVRDEGNGLMEMDRRFYDNENGRFISVDPLVTLGFRAGKDRYGYVGNNPINFIDPEGLESTCPSTEKKSCWQTCMSNFGASYALGVLGVAAPAVSIPKPFGAGALGSGSFTTALSLASYVVTQSGLTGTALRVAGRALNPVANVAAAGAAGYLAGLSASCALQCSGF